MWYLGFLGASVLVLGSTRGLAAVAASYQPITPRMAERTVTLTGHDLTIEQIVQVARYGAKVELSPDARQRETDNYGLLLQAATEGVAVYWFNRGRGRSTRDRPFPRRCVVAGQ